MTSLGLSRIAEETLVEWLPGFVQVGGSPDDEIKITWMGGERFRIQADSMDPGKIYRFRISCVEER